MTLTRLLYQKDHAAASLALCFTTTKSVMEPLFWANELAESGFHSEMFNALWKAFYITCAIDYPHIQDYITQQTIDWVETGNFKFVTYIISKLFTCARTTTVLNHYAHHTNPASLKKSVSVLRGKAPTWIDEYDSRAHQILRHIARKHPEKALSIVARSDNIEFLNATICALHDYIGSPKGAPEIPRNITIAKLHIFATILRKYPHSLPEDTVFTSINTPYGCEPNPAIDSTRNSLTSFESNFIDIAIPITFHKQLVIPNIPNYKILSVARKFPHHPLSHVFASSSLPSVENVRMNWLDLCSECPLWKERIEKHKGQTAPDGSVTFQHENDLESFHDKWDLEFDEQPLHVQQMSVAV